MLLLRTFFFVCHCDFYSVQNFKFPILLNLTQKCQLIIKATRWLLKQYRLPKPSKAEAKAKAKEEAKGKAKKKAK